MSYPVETDNYGRAVPPRPTRQPFKCKCGKIFYTPEIYYEHIKTCPAHQKWLKEKTKAVKKRG